MSVSTRLQCVLGFVEDVLSYWDHVGVSRRNVYDSMETTGFVSRGIQFSTSFSASGARD